MTPEQKQQAFLKEFKELLGKYKVEITMEDFGRCYMSDYKIVADFLYDESLYEENGIGFIPQIVFGTYICDEK
jgi:hypothetical protein